MRFGFAELRARKCAIEELSRCFAVLRRKVKVMAGEVDGLEPRGALACDVVVVG